MLVSKCHMFRRDPPVAPRDNQMHTIHKQRDTVAKLIRSP